MQMSTCSTQQGKDWCVPVQWVGLVTIHVNLVLLKQLECEVPLAMRRHKSIP